MLDRMCQFLARMLDRCLTVWYTMPESKNVGVRIPDDILAAIDERIGNEGKTRSEVILTLIQRGLNIAPSPDAQAILERLDVLEKKLPNWRNLIEPE